MTFFAFFINIKIFMKFSYIIDINLQNINFKFSLQSQKKKLYKE